MVCLEIRQGLARALTFGSVNSPQLCQLALFYVSRAIDNHNRERYVFSQSLSASVFHVLPKSQDPQPAVQRSTKLLSIFGLDNA